MSNKKNSLIVNIFDVLFIMVLCFATLYAALLIQKPITVMHYDFNLVTFIFTVTGILTLLLYVIIKSEKQLNKAFEQFYKEN